MCCHRDGGGDGDHGGDDHGGDDGLGDGRGGVLDDHGYGRGGVHDGDVHGVHDGVMVFMMVVVMVSMIVVVVVVMFMVTMIVMVFVMVVVVILLPPLSPASPLLTHGLLQLLQDVVECVDAQVVRPAPLPLRPVLGHRVHLGLRLLHLSHLIQE